MKFLGWLWLASSKKMLLKKIEAVVQSCSVEKVSMEIWLNSQENTCAKVCYLIKKLLFIKKDSGTGVFLRVLQNF